MARFSPARALHRIPGCIHGPVLSPSDTPRPWCLCSITVRESVGDLAPTGVRRLSEYCRPESLQCHPVAAPCPAAVVSPCGPTPADAAVAFAARGVRDQYSGSSVCHSCGFDQTHALRGAVKVFLLPFRINLPGCEAGERCGV